MNATHVTLALKISYLFHIEYEYNVYK